MIPANIYDLIISLFGLFGDGGESVRPTDAAERGGEIAIFLFSDLNKVGILLLGCSLA